MRLNLALSKGLVRCNGCDGFCRPKSAYCHPCSISHKRRGSRKTGEPERQRLYANGRNRNFEARVRELLSSHSY